MTTILNFANVTTPVSNFKPDQDSSANANFIIAAQSEVAKVSTVSNWSLSPLGEAGLDQKTELVSLGLPTGESRPEFGVEGKGE